MAALSHLLVRTVHVLGMALLLGGAALTWVSLRWTDTPTATVPADGARTAPGTDAGSESPDGATSAPATGAVVGPPAIAVGYEALFWTGVGAMVVTGVGNLGALAPAIPGPGTAWGATLAGKLLAVLGLLIGSALRSLVVERSSGAPRALSPWYAATTAYLTGLLLFAEVLAHG